MNFHVKVDLQSGGFTYYVFVPPNLCPMCHKNISPVSIAAHHDSGKELSVFYFCPSCDKTFLSRYSYGTGYEFFGKEHYYKTNLLYSEPKSFTPRVFDKVIESFFPEFVEIFNQATEAEVHNLDLISGVGFRKSLEFLVKGFCIKQHPEDTEKISKPNYLLGNCIKEYISYPKLQNVSTISAWIGNDETHFTKRNPNLNIDDLKKYIDVVIHYIVLELHADDATALVSDQG